MGRINANKLTGGMSAVCDFCQKTYPITESSPANPQCRCGKACVVVPTARAIKRVELHKRVEQEAAERRQRQK